MVPAVDHTNMNQSVNQSINLCNLHLCQQSSSTLEQAHVFLHSTSCSPSSVATGAQHSAVPHQWQYDVLTGFLSKNRTGDNLMMQGQDCGVCVWCGIVIEEQHYNETL
jgi:hypothetical protein